MSPIGSSSSLATTAKSVSTAAPAEITLDGRYLYGAPAAGLDLEGEVVIGPAERARGLPALPVRPRRREDREDPAAARRPADHGQRNGKAKFTLTLDKQPEATRPLEAQLTVRMAEAGGRAVERKLVAAGDARQAR